jgi:hypothetical protein
MELNEAWTLEKAVEMLLIEACKLVNKRDKSWLFDIYIYIYFKRK